MSAERWATVWTSTHIPSASPIDGFGADGYAVAWVDTAHERLQVLASGAAPEPGTHGRIVTTPVGDLDLDLFVADAR